MYDNGISMNYDFIQFHDFIHLHEWKSLKKKIYHIKIM